MQTSKRTTGPQGTECLRQRPVISGMKEGAGKDSPVHTDGGPSRKPCASPKLELCLVYPKFVTAQGSTLQCKAPIAPQLIEGQET